MDGIVVHFKLHYVLGIEVAILFHYSVRYKSHTFQSLATVFIRSH